MHLRRRMDVIEPNRPSAFLYVPRWKPEPYRIVKNGIEEIVRGEYEKTRIGMPFGELATLAAQLVIPCRVGLGRLEAVGELLGYCGGLFK